MACIPKRRLVILLLMLSALKYTGRLISFEETALQTPPCQSKPRVNMIKLTAHEAYQGSLVPGAGDDHQAVWLSISSITQGHARLAISAPSRRMYTYRGKSRASG